ncbi:MAG: hypothetical protein AAGA03_01990 [Planctomycetota bacterium]
MTVLTMVIAALGCTKPVAEPIVEEAKAEFESTTAEPSLGPAIETPTESDSASMPESLPSQEVRPPSTSVADTEATAEVAREGHAQSGVQTPSQDADVKTPERQVQVVEPEAETVPSERLMLPTSRGTILVDVAIRLGETPLRDAFQAHAASVMAAIQDESTANDAQETSPSWKQAFSYLRQNSNILGGQPIGENQTRDLKRRYDRNQNDRAEADELTRLLHRGSSAPVPFRLRGTNHYRSVNQTQSTLFSAIDRNRDRVLDGDELALAGESLLRFDPSGDRRIDFAEAVPEESPGDSPWSNRKSDRHGNVAMDLMGFVDWSLVSYPLEQSKSLTPFGTRESRPWSLDRDSDGMVGEDEARNVLNVAADVKPTASYSVNDDSVSLGVRQKPPEASVIRIDGPARQVVFRGPRLVLAIQLENRAISVAETGAGEDRSADDEDSESSIRPHWAVQVRGRATEFPDAMFALLDSNHDWILSELEIAAAGEQILRHAQPPVGPLDLPDAYWVKLGRGPPTGDDQLLVINPPAGRVSTPMPVWAKAMDSNGDGAIAMGEFVGTVDQFASLDDDSDGFLVPSEVTR